jgi:prepilin-type N-terminal cleavage/methylation domain-containing protein
MNLDKKQGFTLIELMLAMTFISMLLMAIAVTTIQISTIYTKGITLREVDQAGRAVSDDLQRSIASSSPFDVTPKSATAPASRYVKRNEGGRLCLGRYSYAWNYGKALREGAPYNRYSDGSEVRFAKVEDPGAVLCANDGVQVIDKSKAVDLLTSGDRDLTIHAFTISQTQKDDEIEQALYAITMVIGTNNAEQLTTYDTSCKAPSEGVGDETYCSVNQFDIIARAGNKSGGGQ